MGNGHRMGFMEKQRALLLSVPFWWAHGVMCTEQRESKCCPSFFWGVKHEKSCNPGPDGVSGRSRVLTLS